MQLPDLSKNPALWLGLRQAESLREALKATLNGKPLRNMSAKEWLATQNIQAGGEFSDTQLISQALTEGFEDGFGIHPEMLVRGSNSPDPAWFNLGEERSGAGWRNPANFLITSAFVRLLGAWEQYELDVLKSLFNYRPLGLLGLEEDQDIEEAMPEVIREAPVMEGDKLIFSKPPIWTWLRKHAENNPERTKIFKNVFGISTIPQGYTNKQRDSWYENRNAIAHGRAGVEMSLAEYIEVDVFVAKAMTFVSQQCKDKFKLLV
jgi:hypothetical protein